MLPERQQQALGAARNLFSLLGGVVLAYGAANDATWQQVTGFGMTALMAFFSWRAHELTMDSLLGVLRAGVAAVAAYFSFRGWEGAGQIEQAGALIVALTPPLFSIYVHRPRALNAGDGGVGPNPAGRNVLPSLAVGFFLAPLALSLALLVSGCEKYNSTLNQIAAGVAATDNALAALARNDIPTACGIIAVAETYFAQLRPHISADKVRIEQQAEEAVAAICNDPPRNTAEAFRTLLKLWIVIQTATKAG